MSTTTPSRRGLLSRLARTQAQLDADRLEVEATQHGATHIRDCPGGCTVSITGRLRSVTLRPVANSPAVEADLWDGTGRMTVLWLGRRRIAGITPGRHVTVHGRVIVDGDERLMVNPRYELLPATTE
jgi:hypothetical protein